MYVEIRRPDHKGRVCLSKRLGEGEEVEVWHVRNGVVWKRIRKVSRGGRVVTPFKKKDAPPEGVGILVVERGWRKVLLVFKEWPDVESAMWALQEIVAGQ
jgi:hypothetical protein